MNLPDFLIIGGMKCGSTTLYYDLDRSDRAFFPIDKEPEHLASDRVLTDEGVRAYASIFDRAKLGQKRGEASTAYTKRPVFEGVADRAHTVCGPDLKLVYVVREPVSRAVSHHHHVRSAREMLPDGGPIPDGFAAALDALPDLIDFSRYAHQVRPWIDAFGRDAVLIIRFEDYMRDREAMAARVRAYLGIDDDISVTQERAFNKSEGKPVTTGPWKLLANNAIYRGVIRPMLSQGLKDRVRGALLPKSRVVKATPTAAERERIVSALAADHAELAAIMGITGPVWPR